jgi:hypothetical protein
MFLLSGRGKVGQVEFSQALILFFHFILFLWYSGFELQYLDHALAGAST